MVTVYMASGVDCSGVSFRCKLQTPSVAIGRYRRCLYGSQWWGYVFLYVWFTLGGSKSPGNRVSLWGIRARTGGEPCGDTWSPAVSLVFSSRTDVL